MTNELDQLRERIAVGLGWTKLVKLCNAGLCGLRPKGVCLEEVPDWPTCRAAAMSLIDLAIANGEVPSLIYQCGIFPGEDDASRMGWLVEFRHCQSIGVGETLPLAICRAVLPAMNAGAWGVKEGVK